MITSLRYLIGFSTATHALARVLATLALLALGLCLGANSFPPRGGQAGSCGTWVNGSTIGDTICPQFPINEITANIAGTPYSFSLNVNVLSPVDQSATSAKLCFNNGAGSYGNVGWQAPADALGYVSFKNYATFGVFAQTPTYCTAPSTAYFTESGSVSTGYYSLTQACNSVTAGDTITVSLPPSPIPHWDDTCSPYHSGARNNVTLTFASGVAICCALAGDPSPGVGLIEISGTGNTINGTAPSGVTISNVPTGTDTACVRTLNGASNFTLNGPVTCHDADDCILGGDANVGAFVLVSVTAYNCGAGDPGQDHLVYIGASIAGESDAYISLSGTSTLRDVLAGGWNLKMRPLGLTTQNHPTGALIGCTVTSCEQNGAIDMPCGGNYLIDHTTIETYEPDNFYMIRIGEEQQGPACPISYNLPSGSTTNGSNQITGITTNPQASGAFVGDFVTDNDVTGCTNYIPGGTTILSFGGSAGNYSITMSANATGNQAGCVYKVGPVQFTGTLTASNNTIPLPSLNPATINLLVGYGVTGSNIEAGATIASETSSSITLTCSSSPCVTGSGSETLTSTYITSLTCNECIFIQDGTPRGEGPEQFVAICVGRGGSGSVSGCAGEGGENQPIVLGTICIENSILVQDPTATWKLTAGTASGHGPQVVDCGPGGDSNTLYTSRTAAGFGSWATEPLPPHL